MDFSFVNDDMEFIEADLGHSFQWKGQTVACVECADAIAAADLTEAGQVNANSKAFMVRAEIFSAGLPTKGEKLTHNSTIYRVESVERDTTGATGQLVLIRCEGPGR
jgi:hypothetical protein